MHAQQPAGVPISHRRVEAFLQSVPSSVLVVIDEAYVDTPTPAAAPIPWRFTAVTRTPASCAPSPRLTGLRVGYAVAAPAIAEGLRRTAIPFAVSALAQKAVIASLDAGEEMEARVSLVRQERARMAAELEVQVWKLQPSQGNS